MYVTPKRVRVTIIIEESNQYQILQVCVSVASFIQHIMCIWRFILPLVACLVLLNFFTLPHKWHDFSKKGTELKMNVLIFSIDFVWNISHRKKKWTSYYFKYI
jgi:hypothetical protein